MVNQITFSATVVTNVKLLDTEMPPCSCQHSSEPTSFFSIIHSFIHLFICRMFAPGITSEFSAPPPPSRMGGGGGSSPTVAFDVYYRKNDRMLTTVMKPLLDDLQRHHPISIRWISNPQLLVSPQLVSFSPRQTHTTPTFFFGSPLLIAR
jgi:hypothetical protein